MHRSPGREQSRADPLGTLPRLRCLHSRTLPRGSPFRGAHRPTRMSSHPPSPAAPRTPAATADFATRPCEIKSPFPLTRPPAPPGRCRYQDGGAASRRSVELRRAAPRLAARETPWPPPQPPRAGVARCLAARILC